MVVLKKNDVRKTVCLSEELWLKIKELSDTTNRTQNGVIRVILESFFSNNEEDKE
jgi:predicted DNA-binding protein